MNFANFQNDLYCQEISNADFSQAQIIRFISWDERRDAQGKPEITWIEKNLKCLLSQFSLTASLTTDILSLIEIWSLAWYKRKIPFIVIPPSALPMSTVDLMFDTLALLGFPSEYLTWLFLLYIKRTVTYFVLLSLE